VGRTAAAAAGTNSRWRVSMVVDTKSDLALRRGDNKVVDMQTSGHGEMLSRRFGLQDPPTLVARVTKGRPITFSHLRVDSAGRTLSRIPADTAYSIHVHLREITSFEIQEDGPVSRKGYAKGGSLCFFDLQSPPHILYDTPLHTIRSYVPLAALQEFAEEAGGSRQVFLRPPSCGSDDAIVRHLFLCLSPILEQSTDTSSLFVDQIALALQAHLLRTYATTVVEGQSVRRGLAPWQERRAKEAMNAGLGKDISIAHLASECGLSSSHFARAFRQTTGRPPHRWFLERRLEVAQDLLLNSQMSLKEIANACGFSDQSHLTRAFKRTIGTSPGAWRRIRSG
jgi:AraC family transcriptional regulator